MYYTAAANPHDRLVLAHSFVSGINRWMRWLATVQSTAACSMLSERIMDQWLLTCYVIVSMINAPAVLWVPDDDLASFVTFIRDATCFGLLLVFPCQQCIHR